MNCQISKLALCAALSALLLVGAAATAKAATLDQLVQQLASGDDVVQSNARVMLRQAHDARAAAKLTPLLSNESARIWCAAFNALADQANMAGIPGREADRVMVTDAIMALMAPETSDHLKRQAMRLLPLAVPEGYDVSPVAAQLNNPELAERARAALREIGTNEAAKALAAHLPKAEPAFQAAILHALAMLEDPDTVKTVSKYVAASHPPEVRAAAALALAWTGDPQWVDALQAVRKSADEATVFDASDALLRLADNIAENGGNWSVAMAIYRDVLATGANSVIRGGAMVGLGKYGDDTVLPDIVGALQADTAGDLFGPGLRAIENLQGRAAGEALLEAYDSFPEDMQILLLGIFGRKGDPTFLGPLNEQVNSPDPRFREAAIAALVQTGLPEAMDGMVTYAMNADGENRAQVVAAIDRMAEQYRAQGHGEGAGHAFLGLYRLAGDEETKQRALEGILQFPTPEAFAYVVDDIGTDNLSALSVPMLEGMTRALKTAGRDEEAGKAYAALKARLNTVEAVNAMMGLAGEMGEGEGIAERMGFITKWQIVGPFSWSSKNGFSVVNIGEPNVDPSATYTVEGKELAWQPVDTGNGYTVNLSVLVGDTTNAVAYGYTEIDVAEACDATVRVGSDDGIKVWVNGEAVHENNVDRGSGIDQDQAPIKLKAGVNKILVACTQGAGGWNFLARLTTSDGYPLQFDVVKVK